jgi:hypothetical protein
MGFFFPSARQLRTPKEKAYGGLKASRTLKAGTGIDIPGASRGYDLLEASNDRLRIMKQLQGESLSVGRRIAYKGAAQVLNTAFRNIAPDIGGLGGRAMNIAYGKASARALGYMDRVIFRARLEIKPKQMDRAIQKQLARIDSPLSRWQRSTQALAIANSPDPYAMAKMQRRLNEDKNISELEVGDEILSAYSLKEYSPQEIDQLMKKSDIQEIMSPKVVKASKTPNTLKPSDLKVTTVGNLTVTTGKVSKAKDIEAQIDKMNPEFFDFLYESTGATYAFGSLTSKTKEELAGAGADLMKTAAEIERNREVIKLGNNNVLDNVSGAQIMYIIGFNTVQAHLNGMDLTQKGKLRQTARVVRGDLIQQGVTKRKRWVRQGFLDGESDNVMIHRAGNGLRTPEEIVHNRLTFLNDPTRHKGIYEKGKVNWKLVHDSIDDPISTQSTITAKFSANRQRHNYVPLRTHIQKAIHAQDPDFKNKKSLVSFYVDFGGRTKKSMRADNIRDAFQVEFGGLATDKHGGFNERTDGYVYVPSLFMFRSAMNAAKALQLGAGVKPGKKFAMTGKADMSTVMKSKKFRKADLGRVAADVAYFGARMKGGATKETSMVLDDLAATAKQSKTGELMFGNGNLVLDGNAIGVSRPDLEMISDMLNPNLFGGQTKQMKRKMEASGGLQPFSKAVDDYNFRQGPAGNAMEVDKQANRLLSAKGKEVGRYAQIDGQTYNLVPGSLLRQGVNMDDLILADMELDVLETAPDLATRKLSQAGVLANGERLRNSLLEGFKQKFRQIAGDSVDELAINKAAMNAVDETLNNVAINLERYSGDVAAFVAASDRLAHTLIEHVMKFGKVGIKDDFRKRGGKGQKTVNTGSEFIPAVPGGTLYDEATDFLPQGKWISDELDADAINRLKTGGPTYRDFVALMNDKEHLRAIMKVDVLDDRGNVKDVAAIRAEMESNFKALDANRAMNLNNQRNEIPSVGGKRGGRKKGPSTPTSAALDESRAGTPRPIQDNGLIGTAGNVVYDDIVKKVGGMTTKKQQVDAFEQVISAVERGRKIKLGNKAEQTVFLEVRDATELVMSKTFLQQGYIEHARRNYAKFSTNAGVPFQADTSIVGIQRYIVSLMQGSAAFQSRTRDIDAENEFDERDIGDYLSDFDDDFSEF